MSEENKKYISIGSIVQFQNDEVPKLSIDNCSLREFVNFLQKHGEKYLKGLSKDDILAAQKLPKDDPNYIPRLMSYGFTPSGKAPSFIVSNLSLKVE